MKKSWRRNINSQILVSSSWQPWHKSSSRLSMIFIHLNCGIVVCSFYKFSRFHHTTESLWEQNEKKIGNINLAIWNLERSVLWRYWDNFFLLLHLSFIFFLFSFYFNIAFKNNIKKFLVVWVEKRLWWHAAATKGQNIFVMYVKFVCFQDQGHQYIFTRRWFFDFFSSASTQHFLFFPWELFRNCGDKKYFTW